MGATRRPKAEHSITDSVDLMQDLPSFVVMDLRQRLLAWYGEMGRSLPWRETRDPYAIWVSEMMLQQTQVKTVLPYYERWLVAFPDVEALAIAPQEQVLKLWQGLGYYARARNLHRAAQMIQAAYGGEFPRTLEGAIALPGIGRSTAGGILSAAFNQPVSILDGNVKRVLTRLLALKRPPNRALRLLWQCSDLLLDPTHPRDFNQGLMDLGAMVCTPRQPDCGRCPWVVHCRAYQQAMQNELPVREEKAPIPHKAIGVAVIWNAEGQILIDRRRQEGLLGGLWEFPGGKIEPDETIQDCIRREIREELGIEVVVGEVLTQIDHAYSHFRVTLNVHHCHYLSGEPQPLECDEVRWVQPEDLEQYPFPAANVQIIEAIRQSSMPDFTDHLTEADWAGAED